MKNIFITLMALTSILGFGCGKDSYKGVPAAVPTQPLQATSNLGGNCDSNIVSALNYFVISCETLDYSFQVESCIEVTEELLEDYPNFNCRAENTETGETETVTDGDVREILDDLYLIRSSF